MSSMGGGPRPTGPPRWGRVAAAADRRSSAVAGRGCRRVGGLRWARCASRWGPGQPGWVGGASCAGQWGERWTAGWTGRAGRAAGRVGAAGVVVGGAIGGMVVVVVDGSVVVVGARSTWWSTWCGTVVDVLGRRRGRWSTGCVVDVVLVEWCWSRSCSSTWWWRRQSCSWWSAASSSWSTWWWSGPAWSSSAAGSSGRRREGRRRRQGRRRRGRRCRRRGRGRHHDGLAGIVAGGGRGQVRRVTRVGRHPPVRSPAPRGVRIGRVVAVAGDRAGGAEDRRPGARGVVRSVEEEGDASRGCEPARQRGACRWSAHRRSPDQTPE